MVDTDPSLKDEELEEMDLEQLSTTIDEEEEMNTVSLTEFGGKIPQHSKNPYISLYRMTFYIYIYIYTFITSEM